MAKGWTTTKLGSLDDGELSFGWNFEVRGGGLID